MRAVVVSNRVARAKADEPIEGGLAAALLPAVRSAGAIWAGSSGRFISATRREPGVEVEALGAGLLARIDMPAEHYGGFYGGFSNSVLWPALHSRPDIIRSDIADYASYREINAFMARSLLQFCTPDTIHWIHDYHFLTLGAEMRRLGIHEPIGFFLHTPFPVAAVMRAVPCHRDLVEAMLAYNLIGFQTAEDAANFSDYVETELGYPTGDGTIMGDRQQTRIGVFPIGIDVEAFAARAEKAAARPDVARLRSSLQGGKLIIGVDRADYSKGLANRFRAFAKMIESRPHLRRTVSLLQIAVPSRCEIPAYQELQRDLIALAGDINARLADTDWTPIRYLARGFAQSTLAGFYRTAHIGLVTPLRDGMNLVAKEYVAAQNPFDPGALVLSRFAGAARELDAALLVNPHDTGEMARTIAEALAMPVDERRARWRAMMAKLRAAPVQAWFSSFLSALAASRPVHRGRGVSATAAPVAALADAARAVASLH